MPAPAATWHCYRFPPDAEPGNPQLPSTMAGTIAKASACLVTGDLHHLAVVVGLPPGITHRDYERLFQQDWQWRNPLPEGFEGGIGLATGQFVGARVFPPTHSSGPFIDGMDMDTWRLRRENNYRWETGQNQYPPWVVR